MYIKKEYKAYEKDKRGVKILPIPSFEGYYVSEDGIVYSVKSGSLKEKVAQYDEFSTGLTYKFVILYKNCWRCKKYIHRLVHLVFNNSEETPRHRDGNCFNNHFSNLTEEKLTYALGDGEEWLEGFEGRYFIKNNEVYSLVRRDYPTKLKSSAYFKKKKYSLCSADGKVVTYYL